MDVLTPINGKKGIATAICGDPNSIANISFEQQLSEAQRRELGARPNTKEDFRSREMSFKYGKESC
jgi:hypothetical protein